MPIINRSLDFSNTRSGVGRWIPGIGLGKWLHGVGSAWTWDRERLGETSFSCGRKKGNLGGGRSSLYVELLLG